VKTIIISNELD